MRQPMRPAYVLDFLPTYVLREVEGLTGLGCRPLVILSADSPLTAHWEGISGGPRKELEVLRLPLRSLMSCGAGTLIRRCGPALLRWLPRCPLRLLSFAARALETRCFRFLCAGAILAEELRGREVDLLHAHFAQEAAHVASWAASLLEVGFTVTTHARDIFVPQSRDRLRQVLDSADAVVTISRYNASFLKELLAPEPVEGIRVVRLGLDPGRLPRRAGPDRREGQVCIASGLVEKKGVHVLLEAARLLRRRGAGLSCTVIGGDLDGRRLEGYRRAVEGGPLDEMLAFPGTLPSVETLKLLASAELCVLPSVKARDGDMDGIPVCLMEAAAMGVPIVSTRLSGIPELVVDGETGLLAEPGDPESLADRLQWAADHPREMERMGAAARERARMMFDAQASAGALLEIMREVSGD